MALPIYRATHRKRAYGRVEKHLQNAKEYCLDAGKSCAFAEADCADAASLDKCTADDVFLGICWNAIDSYRGLARMKSVTDRMVFENEEIIWDALRGHSESGITAGPIAAISIHQGSFELLHRSLCRFSNNVHLVTDTLGDGALRKTIQELRSDSHLTEYSPDESRALIRNLFKSNSVGADANHSGNGILAMVVDQGKNTKGNKVKLFGQDSTLYLRLPELVNQMGAGIVTFRTFTRNLRGDIVIRFEKYYPPKYNSVKKESDAPLVESIAIEVENWIRENPAQWSWNYHGNFR